MSDTKTITFDIKRFEPLKDSHPLAKNDAMCPGCNKKFKAGDVVTLIPIGPGDNPDSRAKQRADRPFNAVALPAHWACVTGEEDTD